MRKIGTTEGGGVLVELTAEDLRTVVALANLAPEAIAPLEKIIEGPIGAIVAARKSADPRPAKRAKRSKGRDRAVKECVVCGKSFHPLTSAKMCSAACRREREAGQKLKWAKKTRKPNKKPLPPCPAPAPANGPKACADCKADLDNPKKIVCDRCAAIRIGRQQDKANPI